MKGVSEHYEWFFITKKDYTLYDAELFSEAISTVLSNFNLSEDENTISK